MPQPSENATDGSSVSRLAPRMTVDVNFGDVAGDSDAGSNQGTPGRPLHHFHSLSPSTASFARSPFGSLQVSCSNAHSIVLLYMFWQVFKWYQIARVRLQNQLIT
jgi:hypothetical protein